jgi:predicted unusual protein kinase regulating ubiquinone biosynthesis (AarF/ABC1/UbiB family)
MENIKYVKIPLADRKITEEYPNCIVMEYIKGIKINQIQKEDYEGFAKQIMKFGFVTTIVHGVTHGDLHGGNILFIKDEEDNKYPYKLGVIDFGIIYELESQYKGLVFDMLTQMFESTPRESAIKLLNSGIIDPPGILEQIPKKDYENIIAFTTEIIDETINNSKKANQVQIYKFISKLKEYLSNSALANIGIIPSDNFVKTQLVLAMSHGVTLTLCNNDFMGMADNVINELFHTNMII